MKHLLTLSLCCLLTALPLSAQPASRTYVPTPENLESREAFNDARFGIFIHWGIYSMLGDGEWVMQMQNIDYQEYARLAGGFCPSKFNAEEWVSAIKESGARYITITSRHHDGFSMFGSKASPYNIVDATPFGRDVIGELAQACADQGMRLHFYYSHLDWGRTDFWPQGRTGRGTGRPEGKAGDWEHYMQFVNAQLTELLTQYGPIGCIWFDGVWDHDMFPREDQPGYWNLDEQYALIHKLQPGCLVGNNHHLDPFPGEDIQIFERDIPGHNDAGYSTQEISDILPLETCQTMNDDWGYDIHDKNYKSAEDLIRYLVLTAGKGANLLLNIGPRPDGTLPEEALARLRAIGGWMSRFGDSIYGTDAGITGEQEWGTSTMRDNVLYLHVLKDTGTIELPVGRANKLVSAVVMSDGTSVACRQDKAGLTVSVPDSSEVDNVLVLTFKKAI